jgi:hypothetical protein
LPLLTRNNFYAIGSYDNGVFMVHRVYIYSDLNPHSIMLESDNITNPIMSVSLPRILRNMFTFKKGALLLIKDIFNNDSQMEDGLLSRRGE